jgi:hypothetical protein
MKRLLVLVATAGLAVALYAATAGGGQQAVTPGQFAALKKTVTKLQKDVKTLNSVIGDCLFVQAIPVADFGTASEGYVYARSDGSVIITSALDITTANETPQFFLVGTNTQCAGEMNAGGSIKAFKATSKPDRRAIDRLGTLLRAAGRHHN